MWTIPHQFWAKEPAAISSFKLQFAAITKNQDSQLAAISSSPKIIQTFLVILAPCICTILIRSMLNFMLLSQSALFPAFASHDILYPLVAMYTLDRFHLYHLVIFSFATFMSGNSQTFHYWSINYLITGCFLAFGKWLSPRKGIFQLSSGISPKNIRGWPIMIGGGGCFQKGCFNGNPFCIFFCTTPTPPPPSRWLMVGP